MGRRPMGAAARSETVRVRLTPKGKQIVTEIRSRHGESEAAYIRRLIEQDAKREGLT